MRYDQGWDREPFIKTGTGRDRGFFRTGRNRPGNFRTGRENRDSTGEKTGIFFSFKTFLKFPKKIFFPFLLQKYTSKVHINNNNLETLV